MFKTLEKNIYEEISTFTFYEIKILDCKNDTAHFCLTVKDSDCGTDEEILLDFIYDYDEFQDKAQTAVRGYMLDYIQSQISCYIEDNDYKNWKIKADKSGWLLLSNDRLGHYKRWNIYNKDGYETIQDTIIELLDFIEKQ